MGSFKELLAYKKAFNLALEIHNLSKSFPGEEMYTLTSQIRRSSRAVCSNIAEGFRKRQYPAHFISKISDADMENSETQVWLDFAYTFGYLDETTKDQLSLQVEETGKLLSYMINHPNKFMDQPKKNVYQQTKVI
jgi:four helix bundle protein